MKTKKIKTTEMMRPRERTPAEGSRAAAVKRS
jgi:hypothetical protein